MGTHILIPIDFKIESLVSLKLALADYHGEKVQITLVYPCYLSDSIKDLLFYSPSKIIQTMINPEFEEALSVIKNRFESNIISIQFKLFHGTSAHALKNFVEANKIDRIYIPKSYKLANGRYSYDIVPYIKRTKIPYIELDWLHNTGGKDSEQISTLFI